ncbi:MAG: peptidoglycan-binding protein [Candidatus Sungbacteria bacterium]|uniref:Peptidoglycan-binding protein n=1 Tax=Candidatus Sungiibacteriota bacterium TaxID=2750080 RepID=A0A932QXQ8_9BACT|nr:peptidoglycan-binding protein [Candidatus Sungbacteria bacterium]
MNKANFAVGFAAASLLVPYLALAQEAGTVGNTAVGTAPSESVIVPPQPVTTVCPYDKMLKLGSSGDDVRALQSLLAQDPTIYPEGLKTGFLGSRTSEAVKRLQGKVGLSPSGIVDDDTRKFIWPCVTLRVDSPNGGEVWNVGEVHAITWESQTPYMIMNSTGATAGNKVQAVLPQKGMPAPAGAVMPYFANLSIDLVRSDLEMQGAAGAGIYHIGGASLYGDQSFKWTIPQSIPESKSYRVRISVWKNVPQPFDCRGEMCATGSQIYPVPWQGYLWDESDADFAIMGGRPVPVPLPIPTPDRGVLRKLRDQTADIIDRLQQMLNLLDQLLAGKTQ